MTRKATQDERRRYKVLSRMLKDRQAEIHQKLRSLRATLPAEVAQVRDAEEQSMEEFVVGMDFALMEMESGTLRKIDEALLRLERGAYGVCGDCEEPIAEARLQALPFAILCRGCQQNREDEEASRHARPSRFFEDAPPAAARERRGRGEGLSAGGPRATARAADAGVDTHVIRGPRPARAGRVR
jgi:DnaK suppressor protein